MKPVLSASMIIGAASSKRSRDSSMLRRKAANSRRARPRPMPRRKPALAQQVEHRGILGDAQRVVPGQDDRRGADVDVGAERGEVGHQLDVVGHEGVVVEVVLGRPEAVEAETRRRSAPAGSPRPRRGCRSSCPSRSWRTPSSCRRPWCAPLCSAWLAASRPGRAKARSHPGRLQQLRRRGQTSGCGRSLRLAPRLSAAAACAQLTPMCCESPGQAAAFRLRHVALEPVQATMRRPGPPARPAPEPRQACASDVPADELRVPM